MRRMLLLITMMFSLAAYSQTNMIAAKYFGLFGKPAETADSIFWAKPDTIIPFKVGFGTERIYKREYNNEEIRIGADENNIIIAVQIVFDDDAFYDVLMPFVPYSVRVNKSQLSYPGMGSILFRSNGRKANFLFARE